MTTRFKPLEKQLEYCFKEPSHLSLALTHRSCSGSHNNERLEFLGDAILSCIMADQLCRQFPTAKEGQLSRLRATLVRAETLSQIAKKLELSLFLHMGSGELKSGGYKRDSILADALEAILGAIYLDGGIDAARVCILKLWAERLNTITLSDTLKDPKSRLQEWLQSRGLELPVYNVIKAEGDPHQQTFHVSCHVAGVDMPTNGSGSSRRYAEQQAAEQALLKLGVKA